MVWVEEEERDGEDNLREIYKIECISKMADSVSMKGPLPAFYLAQKLDPTFTFIAREENILQNRKQKIAKRKENSWLHESRRSRLTFIFHLFVNDIICSSGITLIKKKKKEKRKEIGKSFEFQLRLLVSQPLRKGMNLTLPVLCIPVNHLSLCSCHSRKKLVNNQKTFL